jgi:hypothetical protein
MDLASDHLWVIFSVPSIQKKFSVRSCNSIRCCGIVCINEKRCIHIILKNVQFLKNIYLLDKHKLFYKNTSVSWKSSLMLSRCQSNKQIANVTKDEFFEHKSLFMHRNVPKITHAFSPSFLHIQWILCICLWDPFPPSSSLEKNKRKII